MQGSASQEARLSNSHATFITAVGDATALAGELIADQSGLRSRGLVPARVGRRASSKRSATEGLDRQAADTFQLVVGTLDFAGKDASVRGSELERLLVTLGRDQRVDTMPGDVDVLLTSVGTILTEQAAHREQAHAARRHARRATTPRRSARRPRTCTRSPLRASSRRG